MKKYFLTLLSVTLGLVCQPKAETLRVATDPSLPPFEMVGEDGRLMGFDIDLVEAIGRKINAEIKWVPMGFDAVLPAVRTGCVEMAASGILITEDRHNWVTFSQPVADSGVSMLVKITDAGRLVNLKSLKNRNVCVQSGSIAMSWLQNVGDITLIAKKNLEEAIDGLDIGACSAVVGDTLTLGYYAAIKSETHTKYKHQIFEDEPVVPIGLAVNEKKQALVKRVDEAIKKLQESGELQAMREHWFGL